MKFGHLILRRIVKIIATKCQILSRSSHVTVAELTRAANEWKKLREYILKILLNIFLKYFCRYNRAELPQWTREGPQSH